VGEERVYPVGAGSGRALPRRATCARVSSAPPAGRVEGGFMGNLHFSLAWVLAVILIFFGGKRIRNHEGIWRGYPHFKDGMAGTSQHGAAAQSRSHPEKPAKKRVAQRSAEVSWRFEMGRPVWPLFMCAIPTQHYLTAQSPFPAENESRAFPLRIINRSVYARRNGPA